MNLRLSVFDSPTMTFQGLREKIKSLDKLRDELELVKELMKNNMYVLPVNMTMSLSLYVKSLEVLLRATDGISKHIDESNEGFKKRVIPKNLFGPLSKIQDMYNDMKNKLWSSIYNFMKFDTVPEEVIDFDAIDKEMDVLLDLVGKQTTD